MYSFQDKLKPSTAQAWDERKMVSSKRHFSGLGFGTLGIQHELL